MALFDTENLMKGTLGKLNEIITGGDENTQANINNFISWCTPGIPFTSEDFNFLTKGLSGSTGEETRSLIKNAALFSMFIDLVPDPTAIYKTDQGQTLDRNSQERLSKIYENILQFAKISNLEPTESERIKIEKFRNLLSKTIEVPDLVDDTKKSYRIEYGPVKQLYNQYEKAYNDALYLYNNARISALTAANSEAVLNFMLNGPILLANVNSANDEWEANGYKSTVNDMETYISQVTNRSMSIWFSHLKDIFNIASNNLDPTTGQKFCPSFLYPSSFVNNPDWPAFNFHESECETHSSKSSNAWGGSASLNLGLWRFGANAGVQNEKENQSFQSSTYKMSFKIAMVKILRPWFGSELFSCGGWNLEPGTWQFGSCQLSDGGNPPIGNFIAYSTHAIFVKDLVVEFDKSSWESSSLKKSINAGGNVGWGPFNLGGSYKKNEETHDFKAQDTGSGFSCEGMQLIGFINRKVGKTPNPSPNAKFDN
ncbi:hypothetical protein GCM10028808_37080 [Spirosoma migulaei]